MTSEGQAESCISQVLVRVLQINRTNRREIEMEIWRYMEREIEKPNNNRAQGTQAGFPFYYRKFVFCSTQTLYCLDETHPHEGRQLLYSVC